MSRRAPVDLAPGFLLQLRALNLPDPVREFSFHVSRRWRFDYAWPRHQIALEVEGVVYPRKGSGDHRLGGRHVSARGMKEDCIKYGEAFRLGWTVLRVLPEQLRSGLAAEWLAARLLGMPLSQARVLEIAGGRR